MEDFLSRHSELFRTLSEFPEGTNLTEILEQSSCTTEQLVALMELVHQVCENRGDQGMDQEPEGFLDLDLDWKID